MFNVTVDFINFATTKKSKDTLKSPIKNKMKVNMFTGKYAKNIPIGEITILNA